jgi:predicted regulator of Ras-like GTPase activity (Roadblock/LC7/MglB family)
MSSGKRYAPEAKDEIMQYRQTHTYEETSDKYGVSQMTLARWSREYKIKVIAGDRLTGDSVYGTALRVLKYLEGVKAVALYSDEGTTVAMISENTLYEDTLLMVTLGVLSVSDRSSQMLDIGKLEMTMTKCTGGLLFMREAGPKMLLVMLYGGNVDVHKIVVQEFPFIDRVRQDIRNKHEMVQ